VPTNVANQMAIQQAGRGKKKRRKRKHNMDNYAEKLWRCKGKPNGRLYGTLTNQANGRLGPNKK